MFYFVYFAWSQWHSQLYFEINIYWKCLVQNFQSVFFKILAYKTLFWLDSVTFSLNKSAWSWKKVLGSFKLRNIEGRRKSCEDRKDWWKWTCEEVREYFRRVSVIFCSILFHSTLNSILYYTPSYTPLTTPTLTACTSVPSPDRSVLEKAKHTTTINHGGTHWGRMRKKSFYVFTTN